MEVQRAIERSAGRLGLADASGMPSGAGHDAQMMAQLAPMGMIFVPSVGGISHSPRELTRWEDCAEARTSCSARCWRWIERSRWQLSLRQKGALASTSTSGE